MQNFMYNLMNIN